MVSRIVHLGFNKVNAHLVHSFNLCLFSFYILKNISRCNLTFVFYYLLQ